MNLLDKRYKVIADYPHSDHGIGDIFIATDHPNIFRSTINGGEVGNPDEFPRIFKSLAWYEDRTAEELSEIKYFKVISGDVFHPDHKIYYGVSDGDLFMSNTCVVLTGFKLPDGTDGGLFHFSRLEPATLAEYEQYINAQ